MAAGYSSIGRDNINGMETRNGSTTTNVKERIGAIAQRAGVVAAGAKEAVTSMVESPMPEVKLYTQPLNPNEELTIRARIELVINSCRDWKEFFDFRCFNFPPATEVKLRYGHNVETFFYNYFIVSCVTLLFQVVLNPFRGLQIIALLALGTIFYAIHPDPVPIPFGNGRTFMLGDTAKHGLLTAFFFIALIFGNLLPLLLAVLVFSSVVVVVHGFIRDHRDASLTVDV